MLMLGIVYKIQSQKRIRDREALVDIHTKQYEEIKLKLDVLCPAEKGKQSRRPNDDLPDILPTSTENKYVTSYDRRAESQHNLLQNRFETLIEPDDRVYCSLDNLTQECDDALSRAQSSPQLDKPTPPPKPAKPPKKPLRKSKIKRNETGSNQHL